MAEGESPFERIPTNQSRPEGRGFYPKVMMKIDVDERDFEQEAIEEATAIAERDGIVMVVVYAPIENAEDESPWGFCPKGAEQILYRWGEVRHTIGEPIKRRR